MTTIDVFDVVYLLLVEQAGGDPTVIDEILSEPLKTEATWGTGRRAEESARAMLDLIQD